MKLFGKWTEEIAVITWEYRCLTEDSLEPLYRRASHAFGRVREQGVVELSKSSHALAAQRPGHGAWATRDWSLVSHRILPRLGGRTEPGESVPGLLGSAETDNVSSSRYNAPPPKETASIGTATRTRWSRLDSIRAAARAVLTVRRISGRN